MIFFIQAITMGQEKVLAIQFDGRSLAVNRDPGLFGQVIKHPDIMVPCKIVQPDSSVGQLGNLSKDPRKSPGYNAFIFEPKVEQVTQEENV